MKRLISLVTTRYAVLAENVAARVGALVSLTFATMMVAWNGGPPAVGVYALLRVLPSLVGVVIACGLPGACAYFLAGPDRKNRRLPLTIAAMAVVGGAAGATFWLATTPVLAAFLFKDLSPWLVAAASGLVFTRVVVATAKSCSQGSDDLRGSNRVILTEELNFLPVYGVLWLSGGSGYQTVIAGLLIADVATATLAWSRLVRRRFFREAEAPSLALGRRVAAYGLRAQVGGVITLMNLRLDFILLSVMAGPAVLGVYAVASKFAELPKILGQALTYVLYPRFARDGAAKSAAHARRLMTKAGALSSVAIVPLWFGSLFIIPTVYGSQFKPAIVPAQIILLGLVLDGVGGVVTGYLYGVGRPGLNSWAMGAGLAMTLALDVALIPHYGATGAAAASAIAYTTASLTLVAIFWWLARGATPDEGADQRELDRPLVRAETPS
jgi:O-antigen/teichoic acid export membrane protein